ncbi:MAG: ChbG/HpnK family deacetylase [Bacteroidota bacterium]
MNRSKLYIFFLLLHFMGTAAAQKTQIIFRGDDMGFSHSCNLACVDAYDKGLVRTVEVMATGAWFEEAVQMLKDRPGLDVGVHLALTSEWANLKWRPLTAAPSLVDENGHFFPMIWPNDNYPKAALLNQSWDIKEVEAEFRAQIELVKRRIPQTSHITGHMGCSNISEEVKVMVGRLAKEYDLDIVPMEMGFERMPKWQGSQYDEQQKIERLLQTLEELPPGKYLSVTHPVYFTPETEAVHHIGYTNVGAERDAETKALISEKVQEAIGKAGIEIIGYSDIGQ